MRLGGQIKPATKCALQSLAILKCYSISNNNILYGNSAIVLILSQGPSCLCVKTKKKEKVLE